jgi:hypothetical protein
MVIDSTIDKYLKCPRASPKKLIPINDLRIQRGLRVMMHGQNKPLLSILEFNLIKQNYMKKLVSI